MRAKIAAAAPRAIFIGIDGRPHSVAVCSTGDYGIEPGLITSFPIRTTAGGSWEIVPSVPVGDFSRGRIDATVGELREEKVMVAELLG